MPLGLLSRSCGFSISASVKLGWGVAPHNLYSRDKQGIDIDSIDINVTGHIR